MGDDRPSELDAPGSLCCKSTLAEYRNYNLKYEKRNGTLCDPGKVTQGRCPGFDQRWS
jgi:hypothetical protein